MSFLYRLNTTDTNCSFTIADFNEVKGKMLSWANQFSIFCFLDNHSYQVGPNSLECILGVGASDKIIGGEVYALEELQLFIDKSKKTLFGHLAYDLKMQAEATIPGETNKLKFPDFFFFEPSIIIRLTEKEIKIESGRKSSPGVSSF